MFFFQEILKNPKNIGKPGWSTNFFLKIFELEPIPPLWLLWGMNDTGAVSRSGCTIEIWPVLGPVERQNQQKMRIPVVGTFLAPQGGINAGAL